MAKIGIGLDIGAESAKAVVVEMKRDSFVPLKAALLKREEGKPLDLGALLNQLGIRGGAILGVTGKEMIIRYTQVPPMPDWQLKQVMGFEIDDLAAQSGGNLSADFNRLAITSSLSDDDTVLLTLIKNSLLEEYMGLLEGTKVFAAGFTPNSIALYNLLSRTADVESGTSLVVGIGAENIDLVIVQDGALIFARNLTGGSTLFNQALMESFNIRFAKAEKLKKELGCVITRGTADGLSSQEEKIGRSLSGAAGQVYSMIQSSLMFCKAQIKITDLKPDRVFITGGGARLKGLDAYLSDNLNVPVEHYDPAQVLDTSRLENGNDFSQSGPEFSSATGLALMSATPDHYAVQVLPETLKKRKYIREHVVFGILSAVLLVAFLGFSFYSSNTDAALLQRDITKMRAELKNRERRVSEMEDLVAENDQLVNDLALLDRKIIPTTGLVQIFSLAQKYLPDDLWITSIEVEESDREEFNLGKEKGPVIRIRGSGREMGQPLQNSFTEFRQKLDADPMTHGIIPQTRYGENFSFSLLINFSYLPEEETEEGEEAEG